MEDDLKLFFFKLKTTLKKIEVKTASKKKLNWRRPQKNEDNLKKIKMEDDLKQKTKK